MSRKKIKLFFLSLALVLPVFVSNFTDTSRVHVHKFTGDFSVLYATNVDLPNQNPYVPVDLSIFHISAISLPYKEISTHYQEQLIKNISHLRFRSRAPPVFIG